jgi:hypothetical protein
MTSTESDALRRLYGPSLAENIRAIAGKVRAAAAGADAPTKEHLTRAAAELEAAAASADVPAGG